jgi:hypothetical protein
MERGSADKLTPEQEATRIEMLVGETRSAGRELIQTVVGSDWEAVSNELAKGDGLLDNALADFIKRVSPELAFPTRRH